MQGSLQRGGSLFYFRPRPFHLSSAVRFFGAQQPSPRGRGSGDVGVFGVVGLHKPSDWGRLTRRAIKRCDQLRARLRDVPGTATSAEAASTQLLMLDGISNAVCSVIDAAELCRNVHVEGEWRDAAEESFAELSAYIAELNTDTALYRVLDVITEGQCAEGSDRVVDRGGCTSSSSSSSSVLDDLSEEERRFAHLLKSEFERDGIQLPDEARAQLRGLNEAVVALETQFSRNVTIAGSMGGGGSEGGDNLVHVPAASVANMSPVLWQQVPQGSPGAREFARRLEAEEGGEGGGGSGGRDASSSSGGDSGGAASALVQRLGSFLGGGGNVVSLSTDSRVGNAVLKLCDDGETRRSESRQAVGWSVGRKISILSLIFVPSQLSLFGIASTTLIRRFLSPLNSHHRTRRSAETDVLRDAHVGARKPGGLGRYGALPGRGQQAPRLPVIRTPHPP